MNDSFDMFISVVKSLANSQGSYGRMLRRINSMSKDELDNLREHINKFTFNDEIDVILFIEG